MADVATRMLKGGMWIAGARAVTNGLGFLSTILLARLLVPDDFGLVALATSILAIVNAVTALPVSEALIQHRKPTTDHFHTAWSIGVARAVLVALVMAASARPAALIYSDPRLEVVIYAFAFGVALSGLGNPRRIMLNRDLVFWQDALLSVGQKLAMIVVSLLIAWEYKSYWALILGSLAGQVAYVLLSYTALPFLPRITFKHTRDLLSFSVWLSLGQIINTINWRFDQLLIGGLSGRAALGYYSVGDNLAQLPTREAIAPLTQPLYPAFSRVADDHERLRAGYQRAQAFITAVALPIGVGFALLASPLILHFMGEKWAPAVIVAQGLSAIFALQTLGSLAQPLGMAAGATKLLFKRDVQMFFVRLPIITAGILLGGLPGLVAARALTGVIAIAVNMILVRGLIGLNVQTQLAVNLRSLVSVAVMAAGVTMLQWTLREMVAPPPFFINMALTIASGAILYTGSMATQWLFAGRPPGPEAEFARLVRAFFGYRTRDLEKNA